MASAQDAVDLTASDDESEAETPPLNHQLPPLTDFSCQIPWQPVPMPRVRRGRGGAFYNPANRVVLETRDFLFTLLQQRQLTVPLFPANTPVAVSFIFRRQRPLSHFVGHRRTNAVRADATEESVLLSLCELQARSSS